MKQLLIATHNIGKVREFADMMGDLNVNWLSLADAGISFDAAETGTTLLQNAQLKAEAYARASSLWTLADDTGLEIDALGGKPGIYAARYGGEGLTPKERYELVLQNLAGVPMSQRSARFRCVIVLAGPQGMIAHADGVFEGLIAEAPLGDGGFGYDPVFYVPAYQKTLAQMPAKVKHQLSHRGQAIRKIAPAIRQILSNHTSDFSRFAAH